MVNGSRSCWGVLMMELVGVAVVFGHPEARVGVGGGIAGGAGGAMEPGPEGAAARSPRGFFREAFPVRCTPSGVCAGQGCRGTVVAVGFGEVVPGGVSGSPRSGLVRCGLA